MVYGRKLTKQGIFSPVNDSIWVNITLFIFDDLFYSRAKKKTLWNRPEGLREGKKKMKFIFPFILQHACQLPHKRLFYCIHGNYSFRELNNTS